MQRDQRKPGAARRLAVVVAAAAAAIAMLVAGAIASAGELSREGADSPVSAPKQPIGGPGAGSGRGSDVKLSRRKLLAGRPGQRLRVRFRRGHREAGTRRARVVLRRIRREDPRHAGSVLGGGRVAAARTGLGRRGGSVSLRGLNPQPGPHRVVVFSAGDAPRTRLASRRIDVLPQSRLPQPRTSGGPVASAAIAAPTPQALALGDVNHDLSFRPGSEAASAIAVDPGDPARVIAGTGDAGRRPLAYISDQELAAGTVTERRFPQDATLPGGGSAELDPCCEPAVAADDAGNLWMAAAEAGAGGRVAVNRVGAGQAAFQQNSAALPIEVGSAQEKPALAVFDGAQARVAAVWIETFNLSQNVVYSECDLSGGVATCDDPDEWTAPEPVTDSSGLYSMPDLDFAPNGDAYVTWWDYGDDNAVEIDRCEDGQDCDTSGDWGSDATIADLDDDDGDPLPLFCPIIAAPGGLVSPSPDVEIGPGGHVYVAYSDLRDNAEAGAESRCTASGSDQTFDSLVAASGAPNSFPTTNSAVRISADGALEPNDHFLPALSADPSTGDVEVSFYTTAEDPGGQHTDRVYVSSDNLGASFSGPTEISTARSRFAGPNSDGIDYGTRQGADSAAGVFRPVWTDNRALQSRDPDLYALSPPIDTFIDSAPSGTVAEAQGSVEFSSDPVAPRTECRLDGAGFARCTSPLAVGPLPNGPHTVDVRATDRAGNVVDPTPATAGWTIADLDPPETTITKRPKRRSKKKRPVIKFEADEPEATFECRYDGEPWDRCRSPRKRKVTVGRHRFKVRAIDVGGNTDPTAALAKFKRQKKKRCKPRRRRKGRC
jgi:hypothetical protein